MPQPSADVAALVAALGQLPQARLPLAAVTQIHALACWQPGLAPKALAQALAPPLAALAQLPANTASRGFYSGYAKLLSQRLVSGQPACPLLGAEPG